MEQLGRLYNRFVRVYDACCILKFSLAALELRLLSLAVAVAMLISDDGSSSIFICRHVHLRACTQAMYHIKERT